MTTYKNTPRLRRVLLDVIPRQLGQPSDGFNIALSYKKVNQAVHTHRPAEPLVNLLAKLDALCQPYTYYRTKLLTLKEKQ